MHDITGCDGKAVYDKVAKSHVARQQLLRCGEESLDIKEEMLEDLFKST